MEDRFDGKKISDLGFDGDRLAELREHVNNISDEDFGGFGYSANTEHHFQELDDPTSGGSLEADMRSIGKHLGYEHAGTLNQDKVRDFLNQQEETETKPTEVEPQEMEMSPEYAEAKARVEQYQEDVASGRTGKELFGTAPDSSSFLDRYRMKLGERLENGNYRPPKIKDVGKATPEGEVFTDDKESNQNR